MPTTVTIGSFVLGAVLLLVAILGGRFKIFGAEVSDRASRGARIASGAIGSILILAAIGWAGDANQAAGSGGASSVSSVATRTGSPNTVVAAGQALAEYPEEVVQNFMDACVKQGSAQRICSCELKEMESRYTLQEFSLIETKMITGGAPDDFVAFVNNAKLKCAGYQ